jgi:hypothetical protein
VPAISAPLTMLVTLKTNPGAPTGKAHGNYRSGIWTKEWLKLRREASVLRRQGYSSLCWFPPLRKPSEN